MQLSVQLVVDKHIFLQTVLVNAEPSQDCWKLEPDCKMCAWIYAQKIPANFGWTAQSKQLPWW
jgi:hypothetical protein